MFLKNQVKQDFMNRLNESIESLCKAEGWRFDLVWSNCLRWDGLDNSLSYCLENKKPIGILLELESKKITFCFNLEADNKITSYLSWKDCYLNLSIPGFESYSKDLSKKIVDGLSERQFNSDHQLYKTFSTELGKEILSFMLKSGETSIYPLMILLEEPEIVFLDKTKRFLHKNLSKALFFDPLKENLEERIDLINSEFNGFYFIRKELIKNYSSKILYDLNFWLNHDTSEIVLKHYEKLAGFMIQNENYLEILNNHKHYYSDTIKTISRSLSSGWYVGNNLKELFYQAVRIRFTKNSNYLDLDALYYFASTAKSHESTKSFSEKLIRLLISKSDKKLTFKIDKDLSSNYLKLMELIELSDNFNSEIEKGNIEFILGEAILGLDKAKHQKICFAELQLISSAIKSGNWILSEELKDKFDKLGNLINSIVK